MKQPFHCSVCHYLRHNGILLISTLAALCLFLTISKLSILLCGAIFAAVAFTLWLSEAEEPRSPAFSPLLLTLVMEGIGAATFLHTWHESYMAGVIAEMLPFPMEPLILPFCILGLVCGSFAFYRLSCWMCRVLLALLGAESSTASPARMKENWLFWVSSLAFFLTEANTSTEYWGAAALASALFLVISLHLPSVLSVLHQNTLLQNCLIILTATGICLFRAEKAQSLLAFAAFPFLLVCLTAFFRSLSAVFARLGTFRNVKRWELSIYAGILILTLLFVGYIYANTGVFSVADYPYDIIYTGDFPVLVNEDITMALVHHENDLRQPLFALFSAPFTAIVWLLSRLLDISAPAHAWLMNTVQIALLLFSHFLLANLLELSGWKRAVFVVFLSSSYPSLLFSLMMEQYIFAYFYVILFLSVFCKTGTGSSLAFWGASGTMLTSVILLPLTSDLHPIRDFRNWFFRMLDGGMGYILAMAVFGRVDIITGVADHIINLNQFSGTVLTFTDKCRQFTAFVCACFTAPAAEITDNLWGLVSWQQRAANGFHIAGLAVLALCFVSTVLNRKKKSTLTAAGWVCFSFVILVILGWGTAENGLILYSLYFGWAYLILIWQLLEVLALRIRIPLAEKTGILLMILILLLNNIPAMQNLSEFIITHYPL